MHLGILAAKFYASYPLMSNMRAMRMDQFNGKIRNAHAPFHVTGC